jgi:hypothetical protein
MSQHKIHGADNSTLFKNTCGHYLLNKRKGRVDLAEAVII